MEIFETGAEPVAELAGHYRDLMRRAFLLYSTWDRYVTERGFGLEASGPYVTDGMILSQSYSLRLPIFKDKRRIADIVWAHGVDLPVLYLADGASEADVPQVQQFLTEEDLSYLQISDEACAALLLTLVIRYNTVKDAWLELVSSWKTAMYDSRERWSPGIVFDLDGTLTQPFYNSEGHRVGKLQSEHRDEAPLLLKMPGFDEPSRIAWEAAQGL